jgi:hypothetical protein
MSFDYHLSHDVMSLYRMYTVVKKDWPLPKKLYLLQYLYTFYLRYFKPLVIARSGPRGLSEKKIATDFIVGCHELVTEIVTANDDPRKQPIFEQAEKMHLTSVIGAPPLDVPINVSSAVAMMKQYLVRMRALGKSDSFVFGHCTSC